jgi:hypothetical protein
LTRAEWSASARLPVFTLRNDAFDNAAAEGRLSQFDVDVYRMAMRKENR